MELQELYEEDPSVFISGAKTTIDTMVTTITSLPANSIPVKNTKSYYLKCCWLLSQYNAALNRSPMNPAFLDNVKTLKWLLPILREHNI